METELLVEVYLADNMSEAYGGFKTTTPYSLALTFKLTSQGNVMDDLEEVFALGNSDVGGVYNDVAYEPFIVCDPRYTEVVEDYRAAGNRSLSVGDVVCLEEAAWYCASMGWELAVGFQREG